MYVGITKIFPINLPNISQVWDFDSDRCKMYVGITKIFPINLQNLPKIRQVWDFDTNRRKIYVDFTKIVPTRKQITNVNPKIEFQYHDFPCKDSIYQHLPKYGIFS